MFHLKVKLLSCTVYVKIPVIYVNKIQLGPSRSWGNSLVPV